MLHSVQCDDLLVLDDLIHQAPLVLSQNQVFWTMLLHPDEWRMTPPEEEIHFQTPSKLGSPTTP